MGENWEKLAAIGRGFLRTPKSMQLLKLDFLKILCSLFLKIAPRLRRVSLLFLFVISMHVPKQIVCFDKVRISCHPGSYLLPRRLHHFVVVPHASCSRFWPKSVPTKQKSNRLHWPMGVAKSEATFLLAPAIRPRAAKYPSLVNDRSNRRVPIIFERSAVRKP